MIFLQDNIRHLRKKAGFTQEHLANQLDVKRSLIGSYEEGRAVPKISVIKRLSELFEITIDDLISLDISEEKSVIKSKEHKDLQILSTVVDKENRELITIVPVKASAGYLNGYADPEYIGQLPSFSMPVMELAQERTYRLFQIKGDSMLPVPDGAYVLCEYVVATEDIIDGKTYVLITTDEGVVYKRVYSDSERDKFVLESDNKEYSRYSVETGSVIEIWRALGYLCFQLPEAESMNINELSEMVLEMKNEINQLKGEK
jgi:transcriptional regulator with XRE-family HTH domain